MTFKEIQQQRVVRIQRRLHRWYWRAGSFTYFLKRRVTPYGVGVMCAVPIVSAVTMTYARPPMFHLLAACLAVLVVAMLLVFLRRGRLKVERDHPSMASVGERVRYQVVCTNLSKHSLSNAMLEELAPDPRPDEEMFVRSIEPKEELRNSFDQEFAYYRWLWLISKRTMFRSAKAKLGSLKPMERVTSHVEVTPLRRGVIELSDMRAVFPEPLGLFQKSVKVVQEKDRLVVLPKRYKLPPLDLSGASRNQVGGDALSNVSGQAGEFVGLRAYRPGDPLRHIHWPSYGKTGKPVVKEFEDVFFPRYGLVLDTAVPGHKEEAFEEAVSIAASFACAVDTQESLLDLIFIQQGTQTYTVGRGVERVEKMLEILAGVEMDLEIDWLDLTKHVVTHAEDLSACIVVLADWSEERRELLERARSAGMHLLVILVCDPASDFKLRSSVPVVKVEVGRVQEGLSRVVC